MPHSFGAGFYTTQDVPLKPNNNHDTKHKPQVSHSGGQDSDAVKTEANDANKQ